MTCSRNRCARTNIQFIDFINTISKGEIEMRSNQTCEKNRSHRAARRVRSTVYGHHRSCSGGLASDLAKGFDRI
jgi:hypothetical protein